MNVLSSQFPQLSSTQIEQYHELLPIYEKWNTKINLISRKDMIHFYSHHIHPAIVLGKIISPTDGTHILDVGTGGGFPGIPMAILFPHVRFRLIDTIRKKINTVQSIVNELNLQNVEVQQTRIEELHEQFDFITGRAVTSFSQFIKWTCKNISFEQKNQKLNGIFYITGGDIEINPQYNGFHQIFPLQKYLNDPYFETKKIAYWHPQQLTVNSE